MRRIMKLRQSLCWFPGTYEPGDIFAIETGSIQSRLARMLFTPHTNLGHFGFIGNYIPDENDYVSFDSIPRKGTEIGRLSWLDGKAYRVLRINQDAFDLGQRLIEEVSLFGRRLYGYPSIIRMLIGIAIIEYASWKANHRLKTVTARDMAIYMSNKGLLCTQLVVDVPAELGIDILPPGDAALPCAFIEALEQELLVDVTQNISGVRR